MRAVREGCRADSQTDTRTRDPWGPTRATPARPRCSPDGVCLRCVCLNNRAHTPVLRAHTEYACAACLCVPAVCLCAVCPLLLGRRTPVLCAEVNLVPHRPCCGSSRVRTCRAAALDRIGPPPRSSSLLCITSGTNPFRAPTRACSALLRLRSAKGSFA